MLGLWSYFWEWSGEITGVVDCDQAVQNSSAVGEVPAAGGGYWAHFGQPHWSAPRKKLAPSVPIPIPEFLPLVISGTVASAQSAGVSSAQAQQAFGGRIASRQKRQVVSAKGTLAFVGTISGEQIAPVTNADAEMIDIELELFAALAMVA
jgi:hypothetical protein